MGSLVYEVGFLLDCLGCLLPPVFSGDLPARAAYQVASLPRVSARAERNLRLTPTPNPNPPILMLLLLSPQGGLVEVEAVAVVSEHPAWQAKNH